MTRITTEPLKGHSHNSVIYFVRTKSTSFERNLFKKRSQNYENVPLGAPEPLKGHSHNSVNLFRSNEILFRLTDIYFVRTKSYFVRTKSI